MATPAPAAHHLQLANQIAQAVQDNFRSLPKTGKPQPHEHTVLAGIVAYQTDVQGLDESRNGSINSASCTKDATPTAVTSLHVVAVGTGTKCLGGSQRSATGNVLNDSHAEAITRRAFLAWLHTQLMIAAEHHAKSQHAQHQGPLQQPGASRDTLQHDSSSGTAAVFWCSEASRFKLQPGIKFAMFVSQPPCGDASIIQQSVHQEQQMVQLVAANAITEQQGPVRLVSSELPVLDSGMNLQQQYQAAPAGRTGAKLIRLADAADVGQAAEPSATDQQPNQQPTAGLAPGSIVQHSICGQQQLHQSVPCVPTAVDVETGPQQLGALRRKPGKGDPTLSLSCSDKLARWACLGLQGCLLSSCLAEPIYLDVLVVAVPIVVAAAGPAAAANGAVCSANSVEVAQAIPGRHGDDSSPLDRRHEQLLAVEAAGWRAVGSRLAGCCELSEPQFSVRSPTVVAIPATDNKLGLYPDANRKVPSGSSVNWNCQLPLLDPKTATSRIASVAAGVHEATLAATGRRLGTAKKGASVRSAKTRSRLCSAAMFERWLGLLTAAPQLQLQLCDIVEQVSCPPDAAVGASRILGNFDVAQYRQHKQQVGRKYQVSWAALRHGPSLFNQWLHKW